MAREDYLPSQADVESAVEYVVDQTQVTGLHPADVIRGHLARMASVLARHLADGGPPAGDTAPHFISSSLATEARISRFILALEAVQAKMLTPPLSVVSPATRAASPPVERLPAGKVDHP